VKTYFKVGLFFFVHIKVNTGIVLAEYAVVREYPFDINVEESNSKA